MTAGTAYAAKDGSSGLRAKPRGLVSRWKARIRPISSIPIVTASPFVSMCLIKVPIF